MTFMKVFPVIVAALFAINVSAAEKPKATKGKLTSIQGIGEATETKLNTAGVTSVDDLLEKGASPQGREELATKSGLPAAQILKFVNYADLFRIKGIAGQTAELLEAAGVNTVPELAQRTRRFRRLRRMFGMRMHLGQREIAEDKAHPVAHHFLNLFDNRVGPAAIGTFVVAILDERDGCIHRPLNVIATRYRQREL